LRTNLILAAAQPHAVFAGPSANFQALREALASATVRSERLLVQPSLNLAAEMLAAAGQATMRRELVIVSDFQRANWTTADFATLPEGTSIQLESVAPAEPAGNIAILQVAASGRPSAGQEQRLQVEIGNFSAAARNVRVELRLGDASYQINGATAPFSKTTLMTMTRPATSGWHIGEARLVGSDDSLPADDVRPCVLEVPPPPSYLLITRQPPQLRPSSSYYLERALAPTEPADSATASRVQRLAPDKLDNQSLAAADVVVIDHPGKLPSDAIGVLAALVRRGRGVLYSAAEPTDAANLKLLMEALGDSLKMPMEFQPPENSQSRRDLTLASLRRQQPPFVIFGDELTSLTSPLRFSGGLTSRRLPQGLEDDIRAAFSDGSAFLVDARSDAGSLIVMNADLERSNLPVSPLFVPLVSELTQELLAKRHGPGEFASGEPLVMALSGSSDAAGELTVMGGPTEAADRRGEIVLEATGPLWRAAAAGPPAVYEVKRGGQTIAAVAVAIPPDESDLRTLPAELFEGRLAGQRDVRFHAWSPASGERQDYAWAWLAVGCLLCVLGEFAALRYLRH